MNWKHIIVNINQQLESMKNKFMFLVKKKKRFMDKSVIIKKNLQNMKIR